MKSKKKLEARMKRYVRLREYANGCAERAQNGDDEGYWAGRVNELNQRIWELEWVMS